MTKRENIINSLCDLSGYSPEDFEDVTTKEILEDLTPAQRERLREYAGV